MERPPRIYVFGARILGDAARWRPVRPLIVLSALALAGCLSAPPPAAPGLQRPPDGGAPAAFAWSLDDCQTTLHVWLVPLEELRDKTPPEFPPAVLREQGLVDTPMGRIVFYLYDCGSTTADGEARGRSLLGLLGVRVVPPDSIAPPEGQPDWSVTPWVSVYTLDVVGQGAVEEPVNASGLSWTEVSGSVAVVQTPLPDAPEAEAHLTLGGVQAFDATMRGVPGQVENFSRPERYYWMPSWEGGDVRWLDVLFLSTLWETEGEVSYAPGTPWERAVGNRAYDASVDHHAMEARVTLERGSGTLERSTSGEGLYSTLVP